MISGKGLGSLSEPKDKIATFFNQLRGELDLNPGSDRQEDECLISYSQNKPYSFVILELYLI